MAIMCSPLIKQTGILKPLVAFLSLLQLIWRMRPGSYVRLVALVLPKTAEITPSNGQKNVGSDWKFRFDSHASSPWPSGTWQGSRRAEFHKAQPSIWSKTPPGCTKTNPDKCCYQTLDKYPWGNSSHTNLENIGTLKNNKMGKMQLENKNKNYYSWEAKKSIKNNDFHQKIKYIFFLLRNVLNR